MKRVFKILIFCLVFFAAISCEEELMTTDNENPTIINNDDAKAIEKDKVEPPK